MVKRFHGQVRIQDVQDAFDDIVTRINNMQDAYNASLDYADIDYTAGSDKLAAAGYTLSIGGLKTVLEAYDGVIIGARCLKVNDNQVKMTDGLLITMNGGERLPQSVVAVSSSSETIYYDRLNRVYLTTPNSSTVKVCDINMNRNSNNVRNIKGTQVEDINGDFTINTESRTFSKMASGDPMTPDTSKKGKFVCAIDTCKYEGQGTASINLFGETVASNRQTGHRNLNYWTNVNFLYIPKKCSNPYSVSNGDSTKVFDAIENLELKDELL